MMSLVRIVVALVSDGKLEAFRCYYNTQRVHRSLDGSTPA